MLFAVTLTVPTVIVNSSTIEVAVDLQQDAEFEFPCSAKSDDSTPVSIRWYHLDEEVDEEVAVRVIPNKLTVSSNGTLVIRLQKNDMEGWARYRGLYKCRASNSYSSAERVAFIHVNNYVPPGQYM